MGMQQISSHTQEKKSNSLTIFVRINATPCSVLKIDTKIVRCLFFLQTVEISS